MANSDRVPDVAILEIEQLMPRPIREAPARCHVGLGRGAGPAPAMGRPKAFPGEGRAGLPGPARGVLAGPGKHSACVRKVRKVGKVLSVMTRTPFLTFLTFLALGPRKKAAG